MPRLAVNMLVLNAEQVLGRALLPLAGIVDELVVVDSGSEDGTYKVLEGLVAAMKIDRFYYERLHPCGPMFFTDEPASWCRGMPGGFTGRRLLADWAAARNIALAATTADYVLKLDADDEFLSPPVNLTGLLAHLDKNSHVSIASAPYEIMDGQGKPEWLSMYARLWRRDSHRWRQPLHEYLGGKTAANAMYVPSGLVFRDWRDSPGNGVRLEHRNLKVLLHYWENMDPKFGARWAFFNDLVFRFTLAHEAVEAFPSWSRELLANVMERLDPSDVGMRADCHYHKARSLEVEGRFDEAIASYQEADTPVAPHTQALLRAWKRASLTRGEWHETTSCLENLLLARLGSEKTKGTPYNCDLKLVEEVRFHSSNHTYPVHTLHQPDGNRRLR